ncbi:dermonecrotic toxin domain-containing protein [Pseudomonas sp. Z3-8]|uniref:dermonecrotic toxin domain-containing protein n=1 Tax=Pseudomonas sp. Z3-8 TaxID=2817412 RepID=UPI003DA922D5
MASPSPAGNASTQAQTVSLQFAGRPTFEQVVLSVFEQTIKRRYGWRMLNLNLSKVVLATPDETSAGWTTVPFMTLVLDYLATGTPIDFPQWSKLGCFLSENMPHPLIAQTQDMRKLENLLLELPWTVPIGFEDALVRYWNADIDPHQGSSRWDWLSGVLKNILQTRGLQQSGLSEQAREIIDQITRRPVSKQRLRADSQANVYAYSLESTLVRGALRSVTYSSEILLSRATKGGTLLLLCSPGSAVQSFESLEAFHRYWSELIASRYLVDTVTCTRNEIAGNVFDTQAALILEQQLADLRALELPSRVGLQDLRTLHRELSDPARYLLDTPHLTPQMSQLIEPLLPEWLKKAPIADQSRFQHYCLVLAGAKKRSPGQTFLSNIQDIKTFTSQALFERMARTNDNSPKKAQPSSYNPDDVILTFTVARGYPGTVGIIEKKTMKLTELAIHNLVARPSGNLALSHHLGLTLPEWLTPDYITRQGGLIEQVDIGATYPKYLQQKLFDDLPTLRQQRFADQVPAELLLEALKQKLDHEPGITRQGLDLLEAVLQPDVDDQKVDGRPVVIRLLALLRKTGSRPDVVTNMFVIEAQDVDTGPHLLYRPLYSPSLMEFPTRQALLTAIGEDGELQTSVLTWLADAARPVYANGGFLEPHIVHFFQGDEFGLPEKPAPATLAMDGINEELLQFLHNGKLMEYLYGSNARALVAQADRDSVSNAESRWATLLEGGGLLFNTLLVPILRGPLISVAWLWNVIAVAGQDIPAMQSEDRTTRELATVDFLLNFAMLGHQALSLGEPVRKPLPHELEDRAMRAPAPRIVPEQWPKPALPDVIEGPVYLPGEHAQAAFDHLDFSFASARRRLTLEQRTRLQRLTVQRPADMPTALASGPYTGLYVINNKWHALVEGELYQVDTWDGTVQIVDPHDPTRRGPALLSDGQGNWSVDVGLGLRGGMPPKRVEEQRRLNEKRKTEIHAQTREFIEKSEERTKKLNITFKLLTSLEAGTPPDETRMAPIRKSLYEQLKEQADAALKILDNEPEALKLNIPISLDNIYQITQALIDYGRSAISVVAKDMRALEAAQSLFVGVLPDRLKAIADDPTGYLRFAAQLYELNERTIYWMELEHRLLDSLLNRSGKGREAFDRLTRDRPVAKTDSLSTKALQATLGAMLASRGESEVGERLKSISTPLMEQVQSHATLWTYDFSERFEVLESLSEHYGKALDALQIVKALHADEMDLPYFDRLVTLVEGLYQEVSQELATEIKPEPKPPVRAPKRTGTSAGRPQKKVIRTRHNGVLVGDLKPAGETVLVGGETVTGTTLSIDVVELRSENDGRLLGTYSRHEDAWDLVEEVRQAPLLKTRPVSEIKGAARKLLGQLEQLLKKSKGYKAQCRYPQEIEEIMNNEAARFRKVAEELEQAVKASTTAPDPRDQTLIKELTTAATRLAAQGGYLRTELSLKLPPTDGNLRYLFAKELIQVGKYGDRTAMSGVRKDFIQEYAIHDRNGFPLWYAHFHYEKADTPKADYSVAHVKTKEQRKESYYSMLSKAEGPYAVVNVHRGQIGKPLAQRWFLPLDQ